MASVTSFDNVSAMLAAGGTDGQLYQTAGYYTEHDGGAGLYRFESSSVATPDGGTGRWLAC